eukprot:g11097.t1
MTTVTAKDVYVSWNGDLNTWPDFVRKVRLQYEKTQPSKRYLLGPELVSRLTDKAWQASYEIDHDRLSGRHGVKYMLSFLRDKLCRAPVPDAGARLEDLLIRLRRQPGTPFAQWAHEVREHYRRLQRALLRARQEAQPKETSMKKSSKGSSKKSHGSTATEPEPRPSSTGSDHSPSRSVRSREPAIPEDEEQEEEEGEEDEVDDGSPSNRGGWNTWWQWGNQWTAEEWNEWLGKKKKHDGSDSWSAYAEDDEDMNVPWDELEVNDAEVLPDEVLGWILLRRAGLSTQSRLSVQASVGNSLKFEAIERALRDQEEELLAAERRPVGGKGHGYKGSAPRRTFWVEQDREWGLLDGEPDEELQVHWVGHKLPDDVYQHPAPVHEPMPEEEETYWGSASWDDGSWTTSSAWWNDTEAEFEFSPEEQKQIDEVYAAYEDKVTAKGKSKGQKNQKLPDDQIYDFARKEGPDPRDPRFKGGPCKGQHVEAPFGRGSPSGKNGWAMWKTCQNCMLRLEYIPAYGAHAKYRSAGPLSTDTKDQLIEKANEIEKDPSVLRTAEVALDGAERSLHRRLETIQKQKEALKKDKTKDEPQAMRTTTPTQRKSKRTGSQGAEALEAAAEESDGSWTEMPPTGAN